MLLVLTGSNSVSTHSRPKAAGEAQAEYEYNLSFNTQPPEGGWTIIDTKCSWDIGFNTQPPEGGWFMGYKMYQGYKVSTHSRPKAAGNHQT